MSITKETRWHPHGCCHDNSFATGAVLIKAEISSFCLYQERITSHNLLMRVMTTWGLCLVHVGPVVSLWRLQMGIFGFWTERDWSQKSYYGNNTKGAICFFCDGHLWCQVSRTLL